MSDNTLKITACDNELLVVAYQWGVSCQLATIMSGNSNSVDVTIPISPGTFQEGINLNGVNNGLSGTYPMTLESGQWSMVLIGIDWGGPVEFSVEFNGTPYDLAYGSTGDGVLYTSEVISFEVPAAS